MMWMTIRASEEDIRAALLAAGIEVSPTSPGTGTTWTYMHARHYSLITGRFLDVVTTAWRGTTSNPFTGMWGLGSLVSGSSFFNSLGSLVYHRLRFF